MTTQKRRILTLLLFLLISFVGFAGGDVPPPPPPTPPPGLSVGVDVFLLAVLALLLGVRKLLKKDKVTSIYS